jgi:hypothetical protein
MNRRFLQVQGKIKTRHSEVRTPLQCRVAADSLWPCRRIRLACVPFIFFTSHHFLFFFFLLFSFFVHSIVVRSPPVRMPPILYLEVLCLLLLQNDQCPSVIHCCLSSRFIPRTALHASVPEPTLVCQPSCLTVRFTPRAPRTRTSPPPPCSTSHLATVPLTSQHRAERRRRKKSSPLMHACER